MEIPEGYVHKATSDSFNGAQTVVIYYSKVEDDYIIHVEKEDFEEIDRLYVTKSQLELIVHAGTDVIEMAAR